MMTSRKRPNVPKVRVKANLVKVNLAKVRVRRISHRKMVNQMAGVAKAISHLKTPSVATNVETARADLTCEITNHRKGDLVLIHK